MDLQRLIQHARAHATTRPKSVGQRLASGQQPAVLFITCADSRIVTPAITGAEPDTLFELRIETGEVQASADTAFQPL